MLDDCDTMGTFYYFHDEMVQEARGKSVVSWWKAVDSVAVQRKVANAVVLALDPYHLCLSYHNDTEGIPSLWKVALEN